MRFNPNEDGSAGIWLVSLGSGSKSLTKFTMVRMDDTVRCCRRARQGA
jgi:hypothetical protein